MQTNTNPVLDSYQQQLDASRHIAEVVFDGADRMEHLMLDTTRKAFDERMKFYQALAAVRDPQGIAALQSAFFSQTPEQMLKVQQELMHIVSDSQEKIAKTMQFYKNGYNSSDASRLTAADAAGSSHTNGALTSMFAMWDKALKDTFAAATDTLTTVLSPKKHDAAEEIAVRKTAQSRRTSTRAR
jgi:phasin family protein